MIKQNVTLGMFSYYLSEKNKIGLMGMLTSSATDCLAHVFLTWLYIIVLLIPSPQNITNA